MPFCSAFYGSNTSRYRSTEHVNPFLLLLYPSPVQYSHTHTQTRAHIFIYSVYNTTTTTDDDDDGSRRRRLFLFEQQLGAWQLSIHTWRGHPHLRFVNKQQSRPRERTRPHTAANHQQSARSNFVCVCFCDCDCVSCFPLEWMGVAGWLGSYNL